MSQYIYDDSNPEYKYTYYRPLVIKRVWYKYKNGKTYFVKTSTKMSAAYYLTPIVKKLVTKEEMETCPDLFTPVTLELPLMIWDDQPVKILYKETPVLKALEQHKYNSNYSVIIIACCLITIIMLGTIAVIDMVMHLG